MSAPFCKDCAHHQIVSATHQCNYTLPDRLNLVTGEPKRQWSDFCSILRRPDDNPEVCGAAGRFFKASDACSDLDTGERALCDEGLYCEKHSREADAEHAWMGDAVRNGYRQLTDEELAQDLRDAGRGHLVRP